MNDWGGKRKGAGRPKGTFKEEPNQRKCRQVRAFDDEWELIQKFSKIVKYGDKEKCKKILSKFE